MEVSKDQAPIRLAYRLQVQGRTQSAQLLTSLGPDEPPIEESALKRLMPRLHPLDAAIARELTGGSVFGQLNDAQLARLLPLLAQRRTRLSNKQLSIAERTLVPRIEVQQASGGSVRVVFWLEQTPNQRFELLQGRLVIGSQAFFLEGDAVVPVASAAPWELTSWARAPLLELGADIGPARRDELVRGLAKAGVPDSDFWLSPCAGLPLTAGSQR